MTTHNLKLNKEYFESVMYGRKKAEVRFNDRNYAEDDRLILKEWDPDAEAFTGREISVEVSDVSVLDGIGLTGYVLLSLSKVASERYFC